MPKPQVSVCREDDCARRTALLSDFEVSPRLTTPSSLLPVGHWISTRLCSQSLFRAHRHCLRSEWGSLGDFRARRANGRNTGGQGRVRGGLLARGQFRGCQALRFSKR